MSEQQKFNKDEAPPEMVNEIAGLMSTTLVMLCRIADRYHMDRAGVAATSSVTFAQMVTMIDLDSFKANEEETVV